jgi:hypothetical protein
MKKVIIILFAVLLTISVGLLVPIITNRDADNAEYRVENDIPKVNNDANIGSQISLPEDEGIKVNLHTPDSLSWKSSKNTSGNRSADKENKSKYINPTGFSDKQKGKMPMVTPIATPVATPKATESIKNNTGNNAADPIVIATPKKDPPKSWIDSKLDEYKNDIDPSDIPDIKRIYSKIDVGYVQGISQNGMTDDATEKIKDYLRKTLGSDYERAKELFYMYSYLL